MDGYAKVAKLMSYHPETSCLRGFKTLSFQNLLYLQAELVQLENEYEALAIRDRKSGHPKRSLYEKSFRLLTQSKVDGSDEQLQKFMQIRAKLKEYYEALDQHTFVSRMAPSTKKNLAFLRHWFHCKPMGGYPLVDTDRHVWDDKNEADIVALQDHRDTDRFSHWFHETILPMFHYLCGRRLKNGVHWDPESGLSSYSDNAVTIGLDLFGTVISSLLPVGSIAVLYTVTAMPYRLGITAGFTAIFALALALATKSRRVEIFAATTAFAAVQVVFISTNRDQSGNE